MKDAQIFLERHVQRLKTLERDVTNLNAVQSEIRTMNETLVTLTNEHINRHKEKIEAI